MPWEIARLQYCWHKPSSQVIKWWSLSYSAIAAKTIQKQRKLLQARPYHN